jgi:hypothetical protein
MYIKIDIYLHFFTNMLWPKCLANHVRKLRIVKSVVVE